MSEVSPIITRLMQHTRSDLPSTKCCEHCLDGLKPLYTSQFLGINGFSLLGVMQVNLIGQDSRLHPRQSRVRPLTVDPKSAPSTSQAAAPTVSRIFHGGFTENLLGAEIQHHPSLMHTRRTIPWTFPLH